jgi:MSHA biogenesis protein MshL
MLRAFVAASVLLLPLWTQQAPVTRLAGGALQTATQPPATPPPAGGQLPPLPVTRIDPGAAAATLDSPRRLTLSFSEPRPIDEVLQLLVAGTRFSLAIDPDVTGSFRGELKDLTLREALETLLTPLGLDFVVRGTVISVTRHRVETRQFDINVLHVQRGFQRSTGDASAAIVSSAPAEDPFDSIGAGVMSLLSDTGRMHLDRRAGLAVVTDYPERLDRVALYLETLQVRSAREVRLQAVVFEVTLKEAPSIDWRLVLEKLGLQAQPSTAGFAADPDALRRALSTQGDIRPLWSPDVTTLNNEPALVRVTTPGESSLTLTVVPQISADGIIQLSIAHTWEEHSGDRSEGFMKSTPLTRVSEGDSVTRVADGSTVLISGLLRPVQVPKPAGGAAALFGVQPKQAGHAELVVLLKPTIVTVGVAGSKQGLVSR